jgi:bifunctional UDP-N-acetylglucosamine pyrophosphorylase/glucosamine-1-phosphate N-acetyltransferase
MPSMPPLFDELPEPFRAAFDPEAPWTILGEPLDAALATVTERRLAIEIPDGVYLRGSRIAIGEGTEIFPGAVIEDQVWIGARVEIRTGAFVRKGSWIGDGAVVGANTEVKRSILLPRAKAPHLAYVGDSIVGSGVNLGAGTILSNFRHDGATGCNSVLHPGVVLGRDSMTYPGVMLRSGIYPARSVIKLRQTLQVLERR